MEVLERDYCVMECGEGDLEQCQETFYKSKQKDFDELLQLVKSCSVDQHVDNGSVPQSIGMPQPAAPTNLENIGQPVTSPPRSRPLVVLDPATLNKIASSNGCRVSSPSIVSPTSTSGHSLPAVAPNFTPQPLRVATMPPPTVSQATITLASLLQNSSSPRMYPVAPPGQGPLVRVSISPNYGPRPGVSQQPSTATSRVNIYPAHPRLRTPSSQVVTTPAPPPSTVHHHSPPLRPPPPPYYQARSTTQLSNPSVAVQRPRLPVSDSLIPSVTAKPVQPINPIPIINSMSVAFNGNNSNATPNTTKSSLPPPDLPLLPETRPEAASDSRPRRPGPASRTQRLPSASSSADTIESVDLTEDDQLPPPSKKGRTTEKTFPSLIVSALPSLKIFSSALVNNERLLMDNQIRKVMQMSASMFTEYLLQQKLLKAEQFCKEHNKPLKLGIYSDPKRFPASGGYVWIADCCKTGFCSVYAGSIFDKTFQSPSNIVKLMYHWACNTAVHNVLNWVKVDSYILKTYNTFFRAVCTIMVQQKFPLLGGASKKIQVGVISIGTYPEGSVKEVKVDIMAVMDPDIPSIRLKVLENFLSDTNKVYESKFRKILEVLKKWVHPQSTIVTDFAVDLALAKEYGFSSLKVSGGRHSPNNNNGVMDYMRAKIPVMFSNTLGLLSYTIIQQFLDELVWRETWGPFPSRAYDSLVEHLAELTTLPGPDLITKLKSIAADPSREWSFSVWKHNVDKKAESSNAETTAGKITPSGKAIEKRQCSKERSNHLSVESTNDLMDHTHSVDPAVAVNSNIIQSYQQKDGDRKIFLEPYYYGFLGGDPARQNHTGSFLVECILCNKRKKSSLFLSASSFTNHLVLHALNGKISKASPELLLNVCTICCKTGRDIDNHMKETHQPPSKQSFMCQICRIDFKTEEKIVKHMTFVHQELDMPYKCDLCGFQTSIYDQAVVHFKDCHDRESCVRCPYCFKIVRFCSRNGVEMTNNQYYFVQHVQKHSLNKLNRKCEKCLLSFTNMATLKQHQERVHKRSGRFLKNVMRMKLNAPKMLIMSFPCEAPLPPVTLHENSFHTLKGKALSSSVVLPEYYAVCSCLECDGPMVQNHFSVKMTCTRCSFQSSCANSIREHSARRHLAEGCSEIAGPQIIGGSPLMERPMYCTYCSFASVNGNTLTAHLVNCGDGRAAATLDKRKLEAAQSARKIH